MTSSLSAAWARRGIVRALVVADLRVTAGETRLGWLWWWLDPLVMVVIYWFFVVILFGRYRYPQYGLYLGCALLPWRHITASLSASLTLLRSREGLIRSFAFPTVTLPIALVAAQTFYFGFGLLALATISGYRLGGLSLEMLQVVPLLLLQTLLVCGLCLALAPAGALVRDLSGLAQHMLRVAWFLSPGLYGPDLLRKRLAVHIGLPRAEQVEAVFMLNPAALLFTGYRAAFYKMEWLGVHVWLTLAAESLLALVVGYLVYRHFDRRVIKFL